MQKSNKKSRLNRGTDRRRERESGTEWERERREER